MKTLKIGDEVHARLSRLKAEVGAKSFSELFEELAFLFGEAREVDGKVVDPPGDESVAATPPWEEEPKSDWEMYLERTAAAAKREKRKGGFRR